MVLLSKPLDEIEYQDVIDFCKEGKAEGLHLDYKLDFPDQLAKHIAAMANTLGGTILIGVDEEDDKPRPPFEGITYDQDKGYRGRVESIARSNISPPPFFEVANCPNSAKTKTFVVIRVPQSISTPHVFQDGSIYIRTGQSSNRERIASPDEIAWLYERRKQARELKEGLQDRSARRFNNFLTEAGFQLKGLTDIGNSVVTLSACPAFPDKPLFDYRLASQLVTEIIGRSGLASRADQPRASSGGAINAWGQIDSTFASEMPFANQLLQGAVTCIELDEHGLFAFRNQVTAAGSNEIPYLELVYLVTRFLAAARMLYSHASVGYWGFVDFRLEISRAAGRWMDFRRCSPGLTAGGILDDTVVIESKFSVAESEEQFDLLMCRLLGQLAHGCSVSGANDQFHLEVMRNHAFLANMFASVAHIR